MTQRTTLPLMILLLTVALAGVLPGCGSLSAIPSPTPAPSGEQKSAAQPPAAPTQQEGEEPRLVVADAAQYRGTVVELSLWKEDWLLLVLEAYPGTGLPPRQTLLLHGDSRTSFDRTQLAQGDHLEVYYSQHPPMGEEPASIIAANRLLPAEEVYYNGTLVEVSPADGGYRLLLQNQDTPEGTPEEELHMFQTVFWVGEEAQLYLDQQDLVPGQELNIYHKGIYTRSLPPQGVALEVRIMAEKVAV